MTRRHSRRFRLSDAGSPSGEPVFLAVGRLRRPHGVRGELLFEVWTDAPERIQPGVRLFVGPKRRPLIVRSRREHAEGLLLAFEGVDDRDQAGVYRNQVLYVRAEDLPPLPPDEWYVHQVLGLRVVTDDGQPLGVLVEVFETGANDVLVVQRPDGSEVLLPDIEDVVRGVDFEQGVMTVHLLPGLL